MSDTQTICDADGNDLDARFFVEHKGEELSVVIQSSGAGASTRNFDYDEGLRLILERLGTVDALLLRVEVDSTQTAGLSAEARTIAIEGYSSPLLLSEMDSYKLRRAVGGGAAKTARHPNAKGGGNPRKRLRLVLAFAIRDAPSVDDLTQVIRRGDLHEPHQQTDYATSDGGRPLASHHPVRTGQGLERNSAVRRAVEEYAMVAAEQYYARANWTTQRCDRLNLGYDILCTQGPNQLFVEVKGTRGAGARVVVTSNEAKYAHENRKCTQLFILCNIQVASSEAAPVTCTGGEPRVIAEWDPQTNGMLVPKDYYWYIPTD